MKQIAKEATLILFLTACIVAIVASIVTCDFSKVELTNSDFHDIYVHVSDLSERVKQLNQDGYQILYITSDGGYRNMRIIALRENNASYDQKTNR